MQRNLYGSDRFTGAAGFPAASGFVSLLELVRYDLFRSVLLYLGRCGNNTGSAFFSCAGRDGKCAAGSADERTGYCGSGSVMAPAARMAEAALHPASRPLLPVTVTAGKQVSLRL